MIEGVGGQRGGTGLAGRGLREEIIGRRRHGTRAEPAREPRRVSRRLGDRLRVSGLLLGTTPFDD
ncbi:MAG: hypothetical protein ACO396_08335, partial [Phycisphaerales bacterium]